MSDKSPFDRKTLEGLKNYNIPYQEGSWDKFEKFRKKKEDKKRLIFFCYKIAAILFVAFAIGWGIIESSGDLKNAIAEKQLPGSKPSKSTLHSKTNSIRDRTGNTVALAPQTDISQIHLNATSKNKTSQAKNSSLNRRSRFTVQKFVDPSNAAASVVTQPDSVSERNTELISLETRPVEYLSIYMLKPYIPFSAQGLEEETSKRSTTLRYSTILNQNVNRATSSLPGYSFGLGGLTDISLSKKIDLSTGLSLGQQSLIVQMEKLAFNASTSGIPHLDRVAYKWLHAEIPLNVRFRMFPAQKWNMYFSGGLSALGTFGQQFDYTYSNSRVLTTVTYVENGSPIVTTQTLEEESVVRDQRARDKFGFGSTINFALGFAHPLNTANLSIEPFVKYPIGTLTSERLQFLSLGIQLRWSLIPAGNFKKKIPE
tara:strand:+ start:262 stop:1542 length:1281 start_codon:yes stop_codon:yes gene_type:complete